MANVKNIMIDDRFDKRYFADYEKKGLCGGGEKPYWFGFWERFLNKRILPKRRILDCGCGVGYFLRRIQGGYTAVGVDISLYALAKARTNAPSSYLLGSTSIKLPFGNGLFDAVASFELIEHLESPEVFADEVYRVLQPGGYWLLSTPNPQSFGARIKGKRPEWRGKPEYERRAEWHGWRDDTHINIRSIADWRVLLANHGFTIERDGAGGLNDIPYFSWVPLFLQKIVFSGTWIVMSATVGFLPWRWGETYMCCARKKA